MPILQPDMGEKVAGLQVGAGTLSRPGLAFLNDEDTGFASRAAGGISVVVDAVEVLSLTADGIAFPLLTAASVLFVGAAGVLTEDNAAFFFTNATNLLNITGGVVTPAVGPTAAQQHTLPSVASDTVALIAATQILTNKTISLTSNTLTATSLQVLTAVSDETGTGALVFANTPTLISPVLGTPTSGALTNCTGLPAASVLAGTLGAGSYTITADLTITSGLTSLNNVGSIDSGLTNPTLYISRTTIARDNLIKIQGTINTDWYFGILGGTDILVWGNVAGAAERMRLTRLGILSLGTTAETGQAVLDQASTTAAIPVLVLEQRDVDQPFMFYDTTIGTGNATEAVGAKVLTTTHFVMVNIVGVGNRYFPVGTIA